MDTNTLIMLHTVVQQVLTDYASQPYGDIERRLVIGQNDQDFVLLTLGWQGYRHIHHCTIHIEIVGDKVWVHEDKTEDGITISLIEAGIPKSQIVLGFQSPSERARTEYAVG